MTLPSFLGYLIPGGNSTLLRQLVVREVASRFKGSWLGFGWALLTPIGMLLVYTFVFRTVLKARWPGDGASSDVEFALQLFAGLIVFGWFSEVVGRAPNMVAEQPNLVKKVVFPLEISAWVSVISVTFFTSLSVLVLIAAAWMARGGVSVHIVALPLIYLSFLPTLLAFVWLLSAVGVYFRDLGHIVGLILPPLMFLSPVFYPVSALPEGIQKLMWLNPIAIVIDSTRSVLLDSQWPDFIGLGLYFLAAFSAAVFSAWAFSRLRRGFADVL